MADSKTNPSLPTDVNGNPIPALRPVGSQNVSYSAVAGLSAAIASHIRIVRLVATTDCYVVFDDNPVATTSDMLILAGVPEYFEIKGGEKISAVRYSVSGVLNITEMA